MQKALEVKQLTVHYDTEYGVVEAVNQVSFVLEQGEMLGLIGESGSGKTTVVQSILGLIGSAGRVVEGEAILNGVDLLKASARELEKLRWKTVSVIPQNAMNALNPVMTVGEQIMEAILLHERISRKEALLRACQLLEMVHISKQSIKSFPHEFSGGMKQRVAIAMALACSPQVVISDEATTGLDVLTQAHIVGLIKDLQKTMQLSLIFISHDLPLVSAVCERIAIMYAGHLVELAPAKELISNPMHPYSQGLLQASPDLSNPAKVCRPIPGTVPMLIDPPAGCKFQSRCPQVMERCKKETPSLVEWKQGHWAACYLADSASFAQQSSIRGGE
jgi:oligopeptide/dipeptide ABC transporter ATP-binding protein